MGAVGRADLVPVVLSGGSGVRLWPLSRELHPKPFMRPTDGETLLQKTYARAAALDGVGTILTITNRDHFFLSRDEFDAVRKQMPALEGRFLLEPCGRNTAPAVALGALCVAEQFGPETVMLALPADHLIEDLPGFAEAVSRARRAAELGKLATFGIVPDTPETGFGYIECGAAVDDGNALEVLRFVEKPDAEHAQQFLAAGNYLWNSGMLCFKAETILRELATHAPALLESARTCWEATKRSSTGGAVTQLDPQAFHALPNISIDYAVMEKLAPRASVLVPMVAGWSDIGSWNAICALGAADAEGNRIRGETVLVDVADTLVHSDSRVVAAIGVSNLVIVDTPDALLVADRSRTQEVRQVVAELKRRNHESHRLHRTVARPWGTYTVLEEGRNFKIKRIAIKPGAALSLQMHYHRSEHWIVVSGTARVSNNGETFLVRTNESTYISAGHQHRLENPGLTDLVIIEVQSGEYVGEDDIVRFDDVYGRTEHAAAQD